MKRRVKELERYRELPRDLSSKAASLQLNSKLNRKTRSNDDDDDDDDDLAVPNASSDDDDDDDDDPSQAEEKCDNWRCNSSSS